jgi:hypothetical protein
MESLINGFPCRRCVLDTGAPLTIVKVPSESAIAKLRIPQSGETFLESLVIDSVELGPMKCFVRIADNLQEIEMYLGTEFLRSYCITLDYFRARARFESNPKPSHVGSKISFSQGRPTINVPLAGKEMVFVLDTGSNANWLFFKSQEAELLEKGKVNKTSVEASCGLGNINVSQMISFEGVSVGGKRFDEIPFLMANEESFGGPTRTLEDGIIGTGQLASLVKGQQTIDFLSNTYQIREISP